MDVSTDRSGAPPHADTPRTDPPGRWHASAAEEILATLDVDHEQGLTTEEAARRLTEHGPNEVAGEEATPWWRTLLAQFTNPLIYILMVAGVVALLLGEFVDAGFIAAVLCLNASIGFTQERRAASSVQALMSLVSPEAEVVRDGRPMTVDARDVVPGDVVLLASGARVAADLRLVSSSGLRVDESLLTGESTSVAKRVDPVDESAVLADRTNMAFSGATVANGRGRGVVVATGADTELGRIAEQMRSTADVESPLQQRMARLASVIGIVIAVSVFATFLIGLGLDHDVREMLLVSAALAVAAIPEGLPIVVTVALALGVHRMAQRNAIVRNLPAVETLGSTSLIATDKTGTLTQNRMTVTAVRPATRDGVTQPIDAPDDPRRAAPQPTPGPEIVASASTDPLPLARLAGLLANEASIAIGDDGVDGAEGVDLIGDATETAFLLDAVRHGWSVDDCRARWHGEHDIPFESERRYAASYRRIDGELHVFVKGAPDRIAEMCDRTADGGIVDPQVVHEIVDEMAADGLRVLATAHARVDHVPEHADDDHADPTGLTLLALHGLHDPPRDGVREAIEGCRQAGQRVVMVTGDHAATARSIARRISIVDRDDAPVVTGAELETMSDDELRQRLEHTDVFARVAPDHKLRIVAAAHELGHVVAMTGDGVNDGPALKAADIGVAMGRDGTDVAREASDMVLADDNFVSIHAAVEEGRVTFDNVRKVTFFLVSTGLGTFVVVPISLFAGWPLILVPAQLLWANIVTKGLQDLSLAFEPGEPDVLDHPPRPRDAPVITAALWWRVLLTGAVMAAGTIVMYDWARSQPDFTLEQQRTVALTTLVVFQAFHLFSSRSELRSVFTVSPISNRFLVLAQTGALLVHAAALYLPPTQFVLRVEPIPLEAWGWIVLVAFSIVVAIELDKLAARRRLRAARLSRSAS